MRVKFQIDADGRFRRACDKLAEKYKMTSAQIVNQNALDIAEMCFKNAPISDGTMIRGELRAEGRGDAEVVPMTSKQWNRRGKKARKELQSIHLIVNKIRGQGRGLYGEDMFRYSGAVVGSRTKAAGSLKIAFLPAIRALMATAKFKFGWARLAKGIARWPNSTGWGGAKPAVKSMNPVSLFTVNYRRKRHRAQSSARVDPILKKVIDRSLAQKRASVIERAEKISKPAFDEFNRS